MPILIFFILHWYLSLFAQSFLMHRYAAHGSFTMNKFWERFFYIFAYLTMGSSFLSTRTYAIMHRMHHAYTDTPDDPHSPKYFSNVWAMMKHTNDVYVNINYNRIELKECFTSNLPDWKSLDAWGNSRASRIIWGLIYIAIYIILYRAFSLSPWWFLLLPIQFAMSPVHGAIINWFAHKYGYTNFKLNNTSKNLMPVDILMLGEGYHNDHHQDSSNINFGKRWFEIDPIYYIIRLLGVVGIVKIKTG